MGNSKTKKSLLNAITSIISTALSSIISLFLNKTILNILGSEYNGINATISQIISVILILEGGFTLATNVSLFKPLSENDYDTVNGILSATRKRFDIIGLIALAIGSCIAFIYPFFLETNVPYLVVVALMFCSLFPLCVNFAFNMKYRALLLSDQKEYILSVVTLVTQFVSKIVSITLLRCKLSLVIVNGCTMIITILGYVVIGMYCRTHYPKLNFNVPPQFDKIKDTGSVIALKLTSVAYSTFPIIAISMLPMDGVLWASVYAVYKSVLSIVKNALSALTNAPRLGFGALMAEGREGETRMLYYCYEMVVCIGMCVILGTTGLMLMPFVRLYTAGINDIEYVNIALATIMILTVFLEIIHVPSGQLIQMSGRFAVSRRIQTIAGIALMITLIIGGIYGGMIGIVLSTLVAEIILSVLEIIYTGKVILRRSIISFIKNVVPCVIICVIMSYIGFSEMIVVNNYFSLCVLGVVAMLVSGLMSMGVYFMISRESVIILVDRLSSVLKIQKREKNY